MRQIFFHSYLIVAHIQVGLSYIYRIKHFDSESSQIKFHEVLNKFNDVFHKSEATKEVLNGEEMKKWKKKKTKQVFQRYLLCT